MLTKLYDIESMGNIPRYEKGFYFEMNVQMMLDAYGISYEGNPIFYDKWKQYTNTGYDIRIKELHLKIECKYLSKPIYESWFTRDWLSRDADIYVTTNPNLVPYKCRRQLAQRRKKLFTPWQLICYSSKLLWGNKYYLNITPLSLYKAIDDLRTDANITVKYQIIGLKNILGRSLRSLNQSLHRSHNIESHIIREFNTHMSSLHHSNILNFINNEEQSIRSQLSPSFISYIIMPSTGVLLHNNAITHTTEELLLMVFLTYNRPFWSILNTYEVNNMKIVCQVCGVIGYLQHIGKNYYRIRHYIGYENGKPVFKYHKQYPEYVQNLLKQKVIDQIHHNKIDQNRLKSSSNNAKKRAGSPAWIGRKPPKLAVVGSNPTPPVLLDASTSREDFVAALSV